MSIERIGRYEIVDHLATGGMADVLLARTRGISDFEKLLVIKRLLPHLERKPRYVTMFLDEARLAASLRHANIVQVFDVGIDDGQHFMAMEYLNGRDLGVIMKETFHAKAPLPLELALYIVSSAAAGLHYAHELCDAEGVPMRIVHRDVSPQNIFVGLDGHVKLVDFGIAKAEHRSTETRTGVVKGKLGYMSPEQARSQPVDRRTDVYALAVVLWELIANRRLFSGSDDYATLRAMIEREIPPVSAYATRCPAALAEIVARGLARDVEARYPTAEQFQLALEDVARQHNLAGSARSLAVFMNQVVASVASAAGSSAEAGLPTGSASTSSVSLANTLAPTLLDVRVTPTRRRSWVVGMVFVLVCVALALYVLVTHTDRLPREAPPERPTTPTAASTPSPSPVVTPRVAPPSAPQAEATVIASPPASKRNDSTTKRRRRSTRAIEQPRPPEPGAQQRSPASTEDEYDHETLILP